MRLDRLLTRLTVSLGGTPSTTQPTPPPWLSPNVVTRKLWPKVLPAALTINELRRPAAAFLVTTCDGILRREANGAISVGLR